MKIWRGICIHPVRMLVLYYKLSSLRDLVGKMAERGLQLAHTTIMRWVSWLEETDIRPQALLLP